MSQEIFSEMSGWPNPSPLYTQVVDLTCGVANYDQLGQDPGIAEDFPLSFPEGMYSTWTAVQLEDGKLFAGDLTGKFQPSPQLFYEAGLVDVRQESKKTGPPR